MIPSFIIPQTLGVDFLERTIHVEETSIRLMLWDTAGQEGKIYVKSLILMLIDHQSSMP